MGRGLEHPRSFVTQLASCAAATTKVRLQIALCCRTRPLLPEGGSLAGSKLLLVGNTISPLIQDLKRS
jgi:hypothetical protein